MTLQVICDKSFKTTSKCDRLLLKFIVSLALSINHLIVLMVNFTKKEKHNITKNNKLRMTVDGLNNK